MRLIANHPDERNSREYLFKEREEREASHIPAGDPVLFLEVTVQDASDFAANVKVRGEEIRRFRVLQVDSASIPNGIAATLLAIRDRTGKTPARLLRLDRGESAQIPGPLRLFRRGRHRAGDPRDPAPDRPNPKSRPAIHVG